MTVRLGISVEGQTEAEFIKIVLRPHLRNFDVEASPVIVATGRTADGCKAKGGGINLDRVRGEVGRLLDGYTSVTTLYDFYGFGGRKPGESAMALEGRIAAPFGNKARLIAYVQLHEFEALLLSDPAVAAGYFQAAKLETAIRAAVKRAGSCEDVNDGPQTAPSKRLESWTEVDVPRLLRYRKSTKTTHGPQLAARLTLPVIRRACPRFDKWVERLEGLSV